MRIDLFIARRLKLSEPGSRRSTASVRIATVGVALSVTIMLLTLAIVAGFKKQITEKIIGFDAELTVNCLDSGFSAEAPVTLNDSLSEAIAKALPEAKVDLSLIQPGLLKTSDNFTALLFRGYSDGKDMSFVSENMVDGTLPDFNNEESASLTVISKSTAGELGLKTGDRVTTCFFIDGRIRVRNLEIAGIYCSNFNEYDKTVAYASLPAIQKMLGLNDNEGSRVEISGIGIDDIYDDGVKLQQALSNSYYNGDISKYHQVTSVLQTGAMYFNWLSLLDTNVLVIIILMTAISVFTLIASLFILILERVRLIGILKTIGADNSLIRRIFIILASKIVIRGLVAGNVIGLSIIVLQYYFRIIPLDPDAYYISFVPVSIGIAEILILNAAAILVAVAVMIIPSGIICRMNPSQIVRFE